MNAPPPADPHVTERIASIAEFGAKFVIALGIIWAFVAKIAKPYQEWRKAHRAAGVKEALGPELEELKLAIRTGNECADRVELCIRERRELYADLDTLLDIVLNNVAMLDETKERLVARSLMRSDDAERGAGIYEKMEQLREHRRSRRAPKVEP